MKLNKTTILVFMLSIAASAIAKENTLFVRNNTNNDYIVQVILANGRPATTMTVHKHDKEWIHLGNQCAKSANFRPKNSNAGQNIYLHGLCNPDVAINMVNGKPTAVLTGAAVAQVAAQETKTLMAQKAQQMQQQAIYQKLLTDAQKGIAPDTNVSQLMSLTGQQQKSIWQAYRSYKGPIGQLITIGYDSSGNPVKGHQYQDPKDMWARYIDQNGNIYSLPPEGPPPLPGEIRAIAYGSNNVPLYNSAADAAAIAAGKGQGFEVPIVTSTIPAPPFDKINLPITAPPPI